MKKRFPLFTLLELLVVIGVIAILASLLMPALSSARMKVKGASCLSNLKQIAIGYFGYVDDANGSMLPVFQTALNQNHWHWKLLNYNNATGRVSPGGYLKTSNMKCAGKSVAVAANAFVSCPDYGVNPNMVSSDSNGVDSPYRLARQMNPSGKVLITDTWCNTGAEEPDMTKGFYRITWSTTGANWGRTAALHSKSANTLWLDGHATPQPVSSILYPWLNAPFVANSRTVVWDG